MIKTKPGEFILFHKLLMKNAPEGYTPWYFSLIKHNKAPIDGISWKSKRARLTYEQALERLKQGLNVGIAARKDDPLIIIDIDEWDYINQMPSSLIITSRKRCGIHGFFWKGKDYIKKNIPTDLGEIRAVDQYVVAAGSYCITSETDIDNQKINQELKDKIKKDINLGVYTVSSWSIEWNGLSYIHSEDELPSIFKDKIIKEKEKPVIKSISIKPTGKHSALFDLTINNIVSIAPTKREPHPLHDSDTGMNFSITGDIAHCWRHNVSLNALQFLVVKSGYMSCLDAGTGHKNSNAGGSGIINDDGAIFHAWLEAKKSNLIPKDDPVPVRGLFYIAKKNGLIDNDYKKKMLPRKVYNIILKIIEDKY